MITTLLNLSTSIGVTHFAATNPLGGGFILPLVMIVVFWVVLIRPQQKQRKALADLQAAVKKGDKVITIGGMHATVNAVSDKTISLKLADNVFVKYDRVAIATVITAKSEISDKKSDTK